MSVNDYYCKYNLFGHCKFGNTCKRFHVKTICSSFPCLLEACDSRHPPLCKFFLQFGKCKFGENCSFLHISTNDKFTKAEKEIDDLKKEIEALKSKMITFEAILSKIDTMEPEVGPILNCDKSSSKTFSCDSCDLEFANEIDMNNHKDSIHEASTKFKCDLCEYESASKKGVNIHKGSKHKSQKVNASNKKSEPAPTSSASFSTSSDSLSFSLAPPITCIRRVDGCPNIVSKYFDKCSAICTDCSQFLDNLQKSSPFSPQLCPACHQPSGENNYSLCSLCLEWLTEDGFRESDFGSWVLDRNTGQVICTQLDFWF